MSGSQHGGVEPHFLKVQDDPHNPFAVNRPSTSSRPRSNTGAMPPPEPSWHSVSGGASQLSIMQDDNNPFVMPVPSRRQAVQVRVHSPPELEDQGHGYFGTPSRRDSEQASTRYTVPAATYTAKAHPTSQRQGEIHETVSGSSRSAADTLKDQLKRVKVELKRWEKDFFERHGREPTPDDMNREQIAFKYKEYRTLKKKAATLALHPSEGQPSTSFSSQQVQSGTQKPPPPPTEADQYLRTPTRKSRTTYYHGGSAPTTPKRSGERPVEFVSPRKAMESALLLSPRRASSKVNESRQEPSWGSPHSRSTTPIGTPTAHSKRKLFSPKRQSHHTPDIFTLRSPSGSYSSRSLLMSPRKNRLERSDIGNNNSQHSLLFSPTMSGVPDIPMIGESALRNIPALNLTGSQQLPGTPRRHPPPPQQQQQHQQQQRRFDVTPTVASRTRNALEVPKDTMFSPTRPTASPLFGGMNTRRTRMGKTTSKTNIKQQQQEQQQQQQQQSSQPSQSELDSSNHPAPKHEDNDLLPSMPTFLMSPEMVTTKLLLTPQKSGTAKAARALFRHLDKIKSPVPLQLSSSYQNNHNNHQKAKKFSVQDDHHNDDDYDDGDDDDDDGNYTFNPTISKIARSLAVLRPPPQKADQSRDDFHSSTLSDDYQDRSSYADREYLEADSSIGLNSTVHIALDSMTLEEQRGSNSAYEEDHDGDDARMMMSDVIGHDDGATQELPTILTSVVEEEEDKEDDEEGEEGRDNRETEDLYEDYEPSPEISMESPVLPPFRQHSQSMSPDGHGGHLNDKNDQDDDYDEEEVDINEEDGEWSNDEEIEQLIPSLIPSTPTLSQPQSNSLTQSQPTPGSAGFSDTDDFRFILPGFHSHNRRRNTAMIRFGVPNLEEEEEFHREFLLEPSINNSKKRTDEMESSSSKALPPTTTITASKKPTTITSGRSKQAASTVTKDTVTAATQEAKIDDNYNEGDAVDEEDGNVYDGPMDAFEDGLDNVEASSEDFSGMSGEEKSGDEYKGSGIRTYKKKFTQKRSTRLHKIRVTQSEKASAAAAVAKKSTTRRKTTIATATIDSTKDEDQLETGASTAASTRPKRKTATTAKAVAAMTAIENDTASTATGASTFVTATTTTSAYSNSTSLPSGWGQANKPMVKSDRSSRRPSSVGQGRAGPRKSSSSASSTQNGNFVAYKLQRGGGFKKGGRGGKFGKGRGGGFGTGMTSGWNSGPNVSGSGRLGFDDAESWRAEFDAADGGEAVAAALGGFTMSKVDPEDLSAEDDDEEQRWLGANVVDQRESQQQQQQQQQQSQQDDDAPDDDDLDGEHILEYDESMIMEDNDGENELGYRQQHVSGGGGNTDQNLDDDESFVVEISEKYLQKPLAETNDPEEYVKAMDEMASSSLNPDGMDLGEDDKNGQDKKESRIKVDLQYIFKKVWGYDQFREGQLQAVKRILRFQSTLLVLPTGAGKSLTYQLPAYIFSKLSIPSLTLVISPMISLMYDQVKCLPRGLMGACWTSVMQTTSQFKLFMENLTTNKIKILFISPEKLQSDSFLELVRSRRIPPIRFLCVDEVHCLSEWSHNFRPAYLQMNHILKTHLGSPCVLGITGTATESTKDSICSMLNIDRRPYNSSTHHRQHHHHSNNDNDIDTGANSDATTNNTSSSGGVFSGPVIRENLIMGVSMESERDQALLNLLQSPRFSNMSSILIYVQKQAQADTLASFLRVRQFNAESYHAGKSAEDRQRIQNRFMMDGNGSMVMTGGGASPIRILCATIAFGLGLNKSDIRSVIHYCMPKSLENYIQEIGRSGRDGYPTYCHMFLDQKDYLWLRSMAYSEGVDFKVVRKLVQSLYSRRNLMQQEAVGSKNKRRKANSGSSSGTTTGIGNDDELFSTSPLGPSCITAVPGGPKWASVDQPRIVVIREDQFEYEFDMKKEVLATMLSYLELLQDGVKSSIRVMGKIQSKCTVKFLGQGQNSDQSLGELANRNSLVDWIIKEGSLTSGKNGRESTASNFQKRRFGASSTTLAHAYGNDTMALCTKAGITYQELIQELVDLKRRKLIVYEMTDPAVCIHILREPEDCVEDEMIKGKKLKRNDKDEEQERMEKLYDGFVMQQSQKLYQKLCKVERVGVAKVDEVYGLFKSIATERWQDQDVYHQQHTVVAQQSLPSSVSLSACVGRQVSDGERLLRKGIIEYFGKSAAEISIGGGNSSSEPPQDSTTMTAVTPLYENEMVNQIQKDWRAGVALDLKVFILQQQQQARQDEQQRQDEEGQGETTKTITTKSLAKQILQSGRTIAKIFHGIPTPLFTAYEWSRNPAWGKYKEFDFAMLQKMAQEQLENPLKPRIAISVS